MVESCSDFPKALNKAVRIGKPVGEICCKLLASQGSLQEGSAQGHFYACNKLKESSLQVRRRMISIFGRKQCVHIRECTKLSVSLCAMLWPVTKVCKKKST